jgi:hypothetical protein
MDERMQQLESYIGTLKTKGEYLPSQADKEKPNFRSISAAAGINLNYLIKEPYRQRVMLAVQEIGVTPKEGTEASRTEIRFNQNRASLNNYLQWLTGNALKLPEDPTYRGKVFFSQVIVEAGLTPNALTLKKNDGEQAYTAQLRHVVEKASSSLGMEVRVLPQSPGHPHIPFTYEKLFKMGTEERKKQLTDSPSAGAQLSNTRYALNLFLKSLGLEETAPIGQEPIFDFRQHSISNKLNLVVISFRFRTAHRVRSLMLIQSGFNFTVAA